MKTKEAIHFLEYEVKMFPHKAESLPACLEIHKVAERIGEIVELLERGEKFEKMWEKCKKDIAHASVENWKVSAGRFVSEMKELEQKYFSKEDK